MIASSSGGFLSILGDVFAIGSALGCLYLLIAAAFVRRFPGPEETADPVEPVTVLKPLHGADPNLSALIASFCNQNYKGPLQVLCGVRDCADPALHELSRIETPESETIECVVDPRDHGWNRKVSNLANMLPSARHEIVVLADSDIEVGPEYLTKVVSQLLQPNVGAVTCLYHGAPAAGVWSACAALAINSHFLPNIVVALRLGLAQPCFGSTIALRKSTLCKLGGFQAFANLLADDYAIGEAVRCLGHRVAIPKFSVEHSCAEESFGALLLHELRAARTIKCLDPLRYAGTLITHPLPLALLSLALGSADASALVLSALACRSFLCCAVERAFGLQRQPYWLLPFRDLLSFAVFLLSFCGLGVSWRGHAYHVTSTGELAPASISASK